MCLVTFIWRDYSSGSVFPLETACCLFSLKGLDEVVSEIYVEENCPGGYVIGVQFDLSCFPYGPVHVPRFSDKVS